MWAVFQPFMTMVVFTIVFGKFGKIPSENIPYPIFVYVGLLFWQFFSSTLSEVSDSLVANKSIITKVYFPRLILPLSSVVTRVVDFFVASVLLLVLMIYYGFLPHVGGLFFLPLLLLISFLSATGLGLILASINVKFRDVRYVLPFFIQLLLFVTPVIYPASMAGKYAPFLLCNPMTGVIKTAQSVILGTSSPDWFALVFSTIFSLILFVCGFFYFKKSERYFADLV